MARLNEPPVSTDSFETLRKKLLRQNRDLAKLNNVRALRVRELENECACMLSENVQLRARIIDLEKQVEDNETRRIADHALVIKSKLESQLTEWGSLIAELGLEPPAKRHSPSIRTTSKQRRTSFNAHRPSPSQRRLRDVAKDIEDLGHISEHKSFPRRSMNPEQILALRSEADSSTSSPELGPPPRPQFIEDKPVKPTSPSASPQKQAEPSPRGKMEPPETLPSPKSDKHIEPSPSPQKKRDVVTRPSKEDQTPRESKPQKSKPRKATAAEAPAATPTKSGIKRKYTSRDDSENFTLSPKATNENQPRIVTGKPTIRDKSGEKTLKEITNMRKDERPEIGAKRKPLSAKSTNDDVSSPKKKNRPAATDEVTAAKSKAAQDRPRPRAKNTTPTSIEGAPEPQQVPAVATVQVSDLGTPVVETELLAPNSPEPSAPADTSRGDTPPPADISSKGETSRASRRSRGVVSYAEPNLRDKMRRPGKEMVDAVAGSRQSNQFEPTSHESNRVKRESSFEAPEDPSAPEPGSIPASPLARKGPSSEGLPDSVVTERRRRPSSALLKEKPDQDGDTSREESTETIPISEADLYEFTTSSPQQDNQGKRKGTNRQSKSSRRYSTALEGENSTIPKERSSSRRRSMMV